MKRQSGRSRELHGADGRRLHLSLLALQVLLVLLPMGVLAYVLLTARVAFHVEHLVLLVCILVLILSGLLILRRIFDRIASLADLLAEAARGGHRLADGSSDATELREITSSFNDLISRLEDAAVQLDRKVFELSAIRGLIEFSSKSLSADHLLALLLEEAMAVTAAGVGSVLRLERSRTEFRIVAARGFVGGPEPGTTIPVEACLSRLVLAEPAPVVIEDIETDPRTRRSNRPQYGSPSFMTIPVAVGGELYAVLNLASKSDGRSFDASDREVATIMIAQVSVALEGTRAQFEAQEHLKALEQRTRELAGANEALTREVDERRQVQGELDSTNALLRNILDSSATISIISTDLDGTIRFWNRGATNLFGWTPEEVVGREKIGILYPDGETREQVERVKERITAQRQPATMTIRETTRSGRQLWVNLTTSPRLDDQGRLVGLLGIGEDVTQRRELEDQLVQAQKMEAVGTLAGGIAHDFNNLLMGIQGMTSMLLLDFPEGHPARERLLSIEQYVAKAAGVTRQLLGFARGGRYEARPVDIREVVAHTAHIFSRSRKDLEVRVERAGDTVSVEGDRGQLEQVFMNLFLNASQAMPGGGLLLVRTEVVAVGEESAEPLGLGAGRYVRVIVCDTGPGIPPELQARIFDPFFTTKSPGSGTGLGLASAYGIVRNHGGIIKVASEIGKGATFTILLPASDRPVEAAAPISEEVPTGRELVLLVDDEHHVLEVGEQLLKSLGYSVLTASSGRQALEVYRRRGREIALVVLDMIMPGMGGGDTYDALRGIDPRARVLLASGYSLDGEAGEILERGCSGFIQKPYTRGELARKLRSVLDGA